MSQSICYINGEFAPTDAASLPLSDLGILRGFGVFDFLRTYSGRPFRLHEHIQRLENSAKLIGLELQWTEKQIQDIVEETLQRNYLDEANIRIVVTGGPSEDSITPKGQSSLIIIVTPPHRFPASYYEKGIKVITAPIQRFIPEAKSINYIPAMMALKMAREANAVEALYLNDMQHVLEGTTTNFFIFDGNKLITPKDGILKGITREVVIEIARDVFEIIERPIAYKELSSAREAFITASNKEIMPVNQVDDLVIADGSVGANTKKIMEFFRELTNSKAVE